MKQIQRYRPFRKHEDDLFFKNKLRQEYILNTTLQRVEIDIILPTFNRSKLLSNAVRSINNQLHQKWRLYICDDGSTDSTFEQCKQYESDPRIKVLKLSHRGVSSARNSGLVLSTNEYISFLDSDNTWHPEYLSLMVSFMKKFSLDSAYCAAKLIGDTDEQWLGDVFSWQACAQQNYIDLNCFMLKRPVKKILFDETLERFVDWDYILNVTKKFRVSYLSSALVNYCNKKSQKRITTSVYQNHESIPYIKSIRDKHLMVMGKSENRDCRITDNSK